jgi:hypothetical protein
MLMPTSLLQLQVAGDAAPIRGVMAKEIEV